MIPQELTHHEIVQIAPEVILSPNFITLEHEGTQQAHHRNSTWAFLDGKMLLGVHEPFRGCAKDAPSVQEVLRKAARHFKVERNAEDKGALHLQIELVQIKEIKVGY